jgi:ribosome maturation factor RimP
MTASSPVDGVRALAAAAAEQAGLVLEGVTITPAGRRRVLRVVVDLPEDAVGGVPMESVAVASQALSTALDDSPVMGGAPYVLEVSSPGADRPLTEPRHWRRARGRLVRATLSDGREVTGRVEDTGPDGIVLDGVMLGWAELGTGRVELEFTRPGSEADDAADATDEDFDDENVDDEHDDEDDEHDDGEGLR